MDSKFDEIVCNSEGVIKYLKSGGRVMIYIGANGLLGHKFLGRGDEVYGSTSGILETVLYACPSGDLRTFVRTYLASKKLSPL